jgi:hypothetical protein
VKLTQDNASHVVRLSTLLLMDVGFPALSALKGGQDDAIA